MRAIVTRVSSAAVTIGDEIKGAIEKGYLILLGIGQDDDEKSAERLAEKIYNLRVFEDEAGKMNLSLADVEGSLLVISQFTLYADLKSRRPSFSKAARAERAKPLYEKFLNACKERVTHVEHGEFGADMKVASINDGPVTLIFDTED